jgi:hypothetical protein
VFSACYIGKISRFARNDMLLRLFTRPSTLNCEPWNVEPELQMPKVNELNHCIFSSPAILGTCKVFICNWLSGSRFTVQGFSLEP